MRSLLAVWPVALAASCGGRPAPVDGTVVNRYGEPVAGARVRLGEGQVSLTDAAGRFHGALGAGSYDAAVVFDQPFGLNGGPTTVSHAAVYRGLTRRDPTLYLPRLGTGTGPLHSTQVGVTVTGAPAGSVPLTFAWVDARGISVIGPSGTLPQVNWYGGAAVNGRMVALVGPRFWSPGSFSILAAGHVLEAIGAQPVGAIVPVTPAAALTVAGTARPPVGCAIGQIAVIVPGDLDSSVDRIVAVGGQGSQLGAPVAFSIAVGFTDELPLSLTVPVGCPSSSPLRPGSSVARKLSAMTTSFSIDVPAPPQIVLPPAGGAASTTTPFSWTAAAPAVSDAHFEEIDPNGFTLGTLDVMTAGTSTTFPDLSTLGAVVLPGNRNLTIEAWGGVSSTDAAAAPSGLGALYAGVGDFSRSLTDTQVRPF